MGITRITPSSSRAIFNATVCVTGYTALAWALVGTFMAAGGADKDVFQEE